MHPRKLVNRKALLKTLALLPLVLVVIYVAAGVILQETVFSKYVGPVRQTHQKVLPLFLADREKLAAVDVVAPTPSQRDAGPFLHPKLQWEAPKTGRRIAEGPALLKIPDALSEKLNQDAWTEVTPVPDYDLSWMEGLKDFDHWELVDTAENKKDWEEARAGRIPYLSYAVRVAVPRLADLTRLGQIRMLQWMQKKNPQGGLKEIRQLAKLAYSTETLVGANVAASLLGVEEEAYLAAVAKGFLKPEGWKPVSRDERTALRRVTNASAGFFSPLAALATLDAAFKGPSPGLCIGIRESTRYASVVWASSEKHWPLETDSRPVLQKLKAIATDPANGCRLHDARAFWTSPETFRDLTPRTAAEWATLSAGDLPEVHLLASLASYPYLRKIGVFLVGPVGQPSFFRRYEDPL